MHIKATREEYNFVQFRPFKALRPLASIAGKVAARQIDSSSSFDVKRETECNPLSFLHVEVSDLSPAGERAALDRLQIEGHMKTDPAPSYYIYSIEKDGHALSGVVGLASVFDYDRGRIRRHEDIQEFRVLDRTRQIDTCNASTSPVFLIHRQIEELSRLICNWKSQYPAEQSFTADDRSVHSIWRIDCPNLIEDISTLFDSIPVAYIADGHHRAAAASRLADLRRSQTGAAAQELNSDWFLSVLFPDVELKVLDYNRVVNTHGKISKEHLLGALSDDFDISKCESQKRPSRKGEFGLYMGGEWYSLHFKHSDQVARCPVKRVDTSIIQECVLRKIAHSHSSHVDFVGGFLGLSELERRVNSGEMEFAIAVFPPSISELIEVADAGLLMPPKSTWFEPKIMSGLLVYKFDQ